MVFFNLEKVVFPSFKYFDDQLIEFFSQLTGLSF